LKYDHNQALDKATELFWQKGFQGTKMRDLQTHLDMRPGSIYAGFESKENLFLLSLDHYVAQTLKIIDEYYELTNNPLEALQTFVENYIFIDGELKNCKTCLLVKTISESEFSHPTFHQHALLGLQKIEQKFSELFTKAQEQKLINKKADCIHLGKWLQMQVMGLVMYSKSCSSAKDIESMIEQIFSSLRAS